MDDRAAFHVLEYGARRLYEADRRALQQLCQRSADYFRLTTGALPPPDAARRLLSAGPPDAAPQQKRLLGLFSEAGDLVGVLDVVRDYPAGGTWHLGLLLLDPERRGQGVGQAFYEAFETWAAERGAYRIRIGVVAQNKEALRFWRRLGFAELERRPEVQMGRRSNTVVVLMRQIPPEPHPPNELREDREGRGSSVSRAC